MAAPLALSFGSTRPSSTAAAKRGRTDRGFKGFQATHVTSTCTAATARGAGEVGGRAARSGVTCARAASEACETSTANGDPRQPVVVLTREAGKNGALAKLLEAEGFGCVEMPLVETIEGSEVNKLPGALSEQEFEWVVITSPESAAVFIRGWTAAGRPAVRTAVVGKGTARVLNEAAEALGPEAGDTLRPLFVPSKANAVHLSAEIPAPAANARVLYPASAKASTDLQNGLAGRGYSVLRLSTYSTQAVQSLEPGILAMAAAADVVTAGSPSAVKAWRALGGEAAQSLPLACIGSTSARAAARVGFPEGSVHWPDAPGLDGWVTAVKDAVRKA